MVRGLRAGPRQDGGRWRRGESLPGLPAEHYDLFPDRLVPSELGHIPEGWDVKALGEVTDVVGGTTPSTKVTEYWEGGTHWWATPKDLSSLSSHVLLDTDRKITDAGLAKVGSGLLPPGTVLLSSRAPIGYLAISEEPVAIKPRLDRYAAGGGYVQLLPSVMVPLIPRRNSQPCQWFDLPRNQQGELPTHINSHPSASSHARLQQSYLHAIRPHRLERARIPRVGTPA